MQKSTLEELMGKLETKLTQQQLADMLNVHRTSVVRWVRNNDELLSVKMNILIKLCELLHCKIEDLIPQYKDVIKDDIEKQKEYEFLLNLYNKEIAILENEEKEYLCELLNGKVYPPEIAPTKFLRMEIQDSDSELKEKYKIDIDKLITKVNSLSEGANYYIIKHINVIVKK